MSVKNTFYADATNEAVQTATAATSFGAEAIWLGAKYDTGGFSVRTPGPSDPNITVGGAAAAQNAGGLGNFYGYTFRSSFLKFDTSALDDNDDITGVNLSLYINSFTVSPSTSVGLIRVYAGTTGASGRDTFTDTISNPTDFNFECVAATGCTSGTCNSTAVTLVREWQYSVGSDKPTAGQRFDLDLRDTYGRFNTWINRTGDTYIYLVVAAADGRSVGSCRNNDWGSGSLSPPSIPGSIGTATDQGLVNFKHGTSGDGPQLITSQGKSNFQMII
tara:strand:+ start:147 stop:971 length:825 start_codon:yes stop_codon:yes gene_type:complete